MSLRFALFYHSVRSDWNHGNAHFLRGMVRSLVQMGHEAVVYEERRGWSVSNLVAEHGLSPLVAFRRRFPFVTTRLYDPTPTETAALERRLAEELAGVDVVVVHEWPGVENPQLVELLARLKRRCGFLLFFHDTHYRILTQPEAVERLGLERFDSVLAYGPSIAAEYRRRGVADVHVVHEAADVALFHPAPPDLERPVDDALFIGNWGDEDRARELREYLLRPARRFRGARRFAIYGVRYPPEVLDQLRRHYGVEYRGWLPNADAPQAFAQTRVALHVVRQQYMQALPGIPTIRVFEALACGTALVSTRWPDVDGLFREGQDYLVVDTKKDMLEALDWLWHDHDAREKLGRSGVARVLAHHTCRHRAEQLLTIVARLRQPQTAIAVPSPQQKAISAPRHAALAR
ncbi:MAG: Spore_germination_protein_CgeB [uncultured Chloroflexi bacterium]|uniref:Spore_germination_protein_CgeB n=1 Tax=uncultured Chloroflexota bacterium TaxID=166587 RepID=A0A6J4J4D2_9CHLR|nr:MAG: Spore_germination_protein_CgeB [uncultured Chloroflexota bacterium]